MRFVWVAFTGLGLTFTPLPTDPSTIQPARAAGAATSKPRTRVAWNHLRMSEPPVVGVVTWMAPTIFRKDSARKGNYRRRSTAVTRRRPSARDGLTSSKPSGGDA